MTSLPPTHTPIPSLRRIGFRLLGSRPRYQICLAFLPLGGSSSALYLFLLCLASTLPFLVASPSHVTNHIIFHTFFSAWRICAYPARGADITIAMDHTYS